MSLTYRLPARLGFIPGRGSLLRDCLSCRPGSWAALSALAAEPGAMLSVGRACAEVPVMASPGDETAAGAERHARLRASAADREQAIEALKAAFVQDRI